MSKKIEELGLSPATLSVLRYEGIETLEELDRFTSLQILRIPNMGGRRYREVLDVLGRERPSVSK